jgi:hypothetical protein
MEQGLVTTVIPALMVASSVVRVTELASVLESARLVSHFWVAFNDKVNNGFCLDEPYKKYSLPTLSYAIYV